jgi:protein-tyrosine phosphatase
MQPEISANPLSSLSNFRDLGGIHLGDRRLRPNLFYRCARPSGLSVKDIEWLEQRGLVAIIDFRGVAEREAHPPNLSAALMARRILLPIEPSVGARLSQAEAQGLMNHHAANRAMADSYRAYVRENLDVFEAFLRICSSADGPVMFHCSAGKDRTGFAAALLLSALGASTDDIMTDYLRTRTDWYVPDTIRAQAVEANRSATLGVEPEYLEAAFEELDKRATSAAQFAQSCLGGAQALRAFREKASIAVE